MSLVPLALAAGLLGLVTLTGCAAAAGPSEISSESAVQVGDPCPVTVVA